MNKNERCEFCRFFKSKPLEPSEGECRIEPPKIMPVPSAQGISIVSARPVVKAQDFCGKFILELPEGQTN